MGAPVVRHDSPIKAIARRMAAGGGFFVCLLALSACSGMHPYPYTEPPVIDIASPTPLQIAEPGPNEAVVVINDNMKMVHAGMFAGKKLLDPAGSYLALRKGDAKWHGVSLQDYVRFQLEDGPAVKIYRFTLAPAAFAELKARVEEADSTFPIFCATKVQNIISGIPPFEAVPSTWLVTPAAVADHLDVVLHSQRKIGRCQWPDGSSCYPVH